MGQFAMDFGHNTKFQHLYHMTDGSIVLDGLSNESANRGFKNRRFSTQLCVLLGLRPKSYYLDF